MTFTATRSPRFRPLLAAALALTTSVAAQAGDPREATVPTGSLTLLNVPIATISGHAANGFRVTDLEYRGGAGSSSRFDAVLVQNSGAYGTAWWWYVDATAAQITSAINANQARLIDLECYVDSNGNRRFAGVMVDNTGANGKAWWWLYDTSASVIGQQAASLNGRIVDLDRYTVGGTTYYLALMISNTGGDQRSWWWYLDKTRQQIDGYAQSNQARIYDIERRGYDRYDCVMIRDPLPKNWHWWTDLTENDVEYLQRNYGERAIDVERYPGTLGVSRYAMVTINNSNALTTHVGSLMRSTTNGEVGCWLQEVGGPNLAWLNGETPFEPGEALTVLHHAHAMRRVHLGTAALNSLLTVYTGYSSTSPTCPIDVGPSPQGLSQVLREMLENRSNAHAQAVTSYFGQQNINTTASPLLAMHQTSLRHRIGCPSEALANPNATSLRDLHRLYEAVENGWLGNYRGAFYEHMDNGIAAMFSGVILTQAGSLGLSSATTASFTAFLDGAFTDGGYDFVAQSRAHSARFGRVSIPFVQNGVLVHRDYTFGAFVNDASDASAANSAVSAAVYNLLRPTIESAILTWSQNLAGVQPVGSGCGSPVHVQTAADLPRIGAMVDYDGANGYPNQLSVFAMGLSTSQWNGTPLPAPLQPIGGEPGCFAFNDVVSLDVTIADASGASTFAFSIPNSYGLIGFEYLTQFWSISPTTLKTSNSLRNIVGL